MTPTTLDLYLISRLDNLASAMAVLLVLSAFGAAIALCAATIAHNEGGPRETVDRFTRLATALLVAFLCFGVARIAVPTTAEALAMVVIPRAAQSLDTSSLGAKAVEAVKSWLDSISGDAK